MSVKFRAVAIFSVFLHPLILLLKRDNVLREIEYVDSQLNRYSYSVRGIYMR